MKLLSSKLVTPLLLLAIIFVGFGAYRVREENREVGRSVSDLGNKVENVKKDNEYFQKLSSYFRSDAFLEKEARAKLNYKMPDEEVVFVYKDVNKKSPEPKSEEKSGNLPKWKKWLNYLRGHKK